jgi:carboxypeptidase family protein
MRNLPPNSAISRGRLLQALAVFVLILSIPAAFSQKKKDDQANTRSLEGVVMSAEDAPLSGAVVQLKNTKTLQIRSFVTQDDGHYYFHGLNTDIDYEVKADYKGQSSATHTLSSFDSRKDAVLNLKMKKKGE